MINRSHGVTEVEEPSERLKYSAAGFEDGRWVQEPCRQPLEATKDKETEPPEGMQPC